MEKTAFTVYTHQQRPELKERLDSFGEVWPELIYHDETAAKYIHHTTSTFANLNLYLCDQSDELVATGYGVPLIWNGSPETLSSGWDAALAQSVSDYEARRTPDTFCALGAMVRQSEHGRGLSKYILQAMKSAARQANLVRMIAPVRPTLKSRYPLTPIERYITWQQPDGSLFDPWLRVHTKEGGKIVKVASESMTIRGTVANWEQWTNMRFPESGQYIVLGALHPVSIDAERDEGLYIEPNVWVQHFL